MAEGEKPKKVHKKNAKKEQKKKERQNGGKTEKHNPKAFTFSGGTRSVQKRVQFQLEKAAKKERAPKTDKTPDVPPPFVVVVQGPPGVGKTTLVKSLVRHYCRQRLLELRGPITLVSGRQRRLTIIEAPQDMSAMLDLAKVADLVLCIIDASYGFELETFEFINILQVHGFPRVIGILTHLDGFKDTKQLRKVKKTMKHRFWTEIYDGAKLFYFSGLQYGRYHRLEVQNLARFIAVQKSSILSWRQSHPYILGLRWEDQSDPMLPESAPRKLDLYGYVYGGRLREGSEAHLAGVGDFTISSIKALPDPCPPPVDVEAERRKLQGKDKDKDGRPKKKNALRTLNESHRLVYAPGSDIGSITVDADTMYINVAEAETGFTRKEMEGDIDEEDMPEAVRMVRELQDAPVSRAGRNGEALQLTANKTVRLPPVQAPSADERRPAPGQGASVGLDSASEGEEGGDENEDDEDEDSEEESGAESADEAPDGAAPNGAATGEVDDAEEGAEARQAHRRQVVEGAKRRFQRAPRLEEVIYGRGRGKAVAATTAVLGGAATDHKTLDLFDEDQDDEEKAAQRPAQRGGESLLGNLGDLDGLDTARMPTLPGYSEPWNEERREALKSRKFITGGWSSAEEDEEADPACKAAKAAAAGAEGANPGDGDAAAEAPPPIDQAELEGYKDGAGIATFVRIRLEAVPAACVAELRRDRLLVLGGLLAGESRLGLVQVRVKRHRWHPKLLKSGDAMLMSVGWRRFQTVPTFSLEDRGEKRMRYLKYSLEHAHCAMTYYGPAVPPNTGVMAFRSWNKVGHFRICGTGGVLETAPNFDIMKKLKLVGEPYKIFKNTAFIRNMFNSDLEVNKYLKTKIQTVSGIRGEIKKAEGDRGNFRATFEDRILLSDLVVCKCWIGVQPRQFYHPVVDVEKWRPARLIGELRANAGVAVPDNRDSQYGKQLVRPERKFNTLKIPKALEASLPFKTRPKLDSKKKKNGLSKKCAIVSSERERDINTLLIRLHTVRKEKYRLRKESSGKKKVLKEKRDKFIQDKRDAYTKEAKKKRYIKEGEQEGQKRKSMKLD